MLGKLLAGLRDLSVADPGIEPSKRLLEVAPQHDLVVILPAQRAAFPEHFLVVGLDDLPIQLVVQQRGGAVLDQLIFGIVVQHGRTSPSVLSYSSISPDMSLGSKRSRASCNNRF